MSGPDERPGEFRRQLLRMLNGYRDGDRFEPTTDQPKRSTRARRPKSTAKRQRRSMTSEKTSPGDDGDRVGAD